MQRVITGYQIVTYLTGYYIVPLEAPTYPPGTKIRITIPITNNSTVEVDVKLKLFVYEGRFGIPHGPLIAEYETDPKSIPVNGTVDFSIEHTTVLRDETRRDVGAMVRYYDEYEKEWKDGPTEEWDDVFYVYVVYEFRIGAPTVELAE